MRIISLLPPPKISKEGVRYWDFSLDDLKNMPEHLVLTGKTNYPTDEDGIRNLPSLKIEDTEDFEEKVYNYVNSALKLMGYV